MKSRRRHIIPLIVLVLALFQIFYEVPLTSWLELKSIDLRYRQRGPSEATGDVVVVSIDEKSLSKEGRWPWPREKHATLIEKIETAGARLIELDILFAESTPHDVILSQAIKRRDQVVLGYYFYENTQDLKLADLDTAIINQSFRSISSSAQDLTPQASQGFFDMVAVLANTPTIAAATKRKGYFNIIADSDGVVRRPALLVNYRKHSFASLCLSMLANGEVKAVTTRSGDLRGLQLGDKEIPVDAQARTWINFRKHIPLYSAADVFTGQLEANELKDKIVLVGATAVGLFDNHVTSVSINAPSVMIQANLIDTIIKGDFIISNSWTRMASLFWTYLIILGLSFAVPRIRILSGVALVLAVIAIHLLLVQWIFEQGYIIAAVIPPLNWLLLFGALIVYRSLVEEREKRAIRRAFQAYLHPDVVEELTSNLNQLQLGGQRMECTILFADVRNFTHISEQVPPERLVELMNLYFDPVAKIIIEQGGYIDKFIGDAVMAVFGAPKPNPDHALQACRAALLIEKAVSRLAPEIEANFGIKNFKIGLGVHSGDVIVGNIGTRERLNYTVMGDPVNVASRLETVTKELDIHICISESTEQQVNGKLSTRLMGEVTLRGKEEAQRVFELTSS